jgi:hypothetical protein
MYLIAFGAQGLARLGGAERETRTWVANSKGCLTETLSQEVRHHERNARIENSSHAIHRQVDTQDFVFAEGTALSARAVAAPPWKRLAAYAYQNSSQSRIHRINRQARDEIEGHCSRVFLDQTGKDNHNSAQRNVPLGETTPQARKR